MMNKYVISLARGTLFALALTTGAAHSDTFLETFGKTATRQRSLYVPQFAAAGAVSYYQFADPTVAGVSRDLDNGYYAVLNPNQVIATGGASWWANGDTGPASAFTDHTGDGGAVLIVNAGNVQNAVYRRIVSLEGGKTYTLAAWRLVVNGPTDLGFELREPDDTASLGSSPGFTTTGSTGAGQWVRLSWNFTTPGVCTTRQYAVSVRNNSPVTNGNDLFLDDISIAEASGGAAGQVTCPTTSVPTVTAVNDTGTTPPDRPVTIALRANDSSSNPTAAALGLPSQGNTPAQHGTVVFNNDGTATYTPNAGYTGNDAFSYDICTVASQTNPTPFCSTASVAVSVAVPTVAAGDDRASTQMGRPATVNLLANDTSSNPAAAPLGTPSAGSVSPRNGSVVFNADGTATYTPNPAFTGTDSFSYKVCTVVSAGNPTASCSEATVNVTVTLPAILAIPTLSEWGILLMSSLLALLGIGAARRRTR